MAHLDADKAENKVFAQKYGVSGFPTIKVRSLSFRRPRVAPLTPQTQFLPSGGRAPIDYSGARSEEAFLEFLNKQCGTHRLPGGLLSDLVRSPLLPFHSPANPDPTQAGRIPSLDALALTYFSPTAVRSAILASASEVASQITDSSAALSAYYLKVMAKFVEDAEGAEAWVKKEGERLGKMASKRGKIAGAKLDELKMRQNVRRLLPFGPWGWN